NQIMEASNVRELNADVVIVATGGMPNLENIPGGELCLSTWDVLSTTTCQLSGKVLVYDETGRHPAPMAAARILNAGATLTYVSIDADIGEELTRFERLMFKKRLRELGNYDFLTDTRLTSVQRQGRQLQIVL